MALTENDYKLIDELKVISYSIYDSYAKLRELEITGKQESIDYQVIIDSIKSLKILEDNLYSKIEFDYDKVMELIQYVLADGKLTRTIEEDLMLAQSKNIKCMVLRRISAKIGYNHNARNEEIHKEENLMLLSNPNMVIFSPHHIKVIYFALEQDIMNTIFSLANLYIKDPNYLSFKEDLLNFKYNLSYLYPFIESNNLTSKFQEYPLYWLKSMYCDMYHINEGAIKMDKVEKLVEYFLNLLVEEIFVDYNGKEVRALYEKEIIFMIIFIRAGFMFAGKQDILNLKATFEREVVNATIKDGNLEVEEKLLQMFELSLKDKEMLALVRTKNNRKNVNEEN